MIKKSLLLLILILFAQAGAVCADVVYLKNGATLRGVIAGSDADATILAVDIGHMTIPNSSIHEITRESASDNFFLQKAWKDIKSDIDFKRKFVAESERRSKKIFQNREIFSETASDDVTIRNIMCDDRKHFYTLILPPDYDRRQKMPVLFVFDPRADGTNAARQFSFAARQHHWIIVGSLDWKNNHWEDQRHVQDALLRDIRNKYKVDTGRMYTAGFSGAVDMAYAMAERYPEHIRGVIAVSANRYYKMSYKTESRVPVYYGVIKNDANILSAKRAITQLKLKGTRAKIHIFDESPSVPPRILSGAVSWVNARQ